MKVKLVGFIALSFFIFAMIVLARQVLDSNLGPGWQWLWVLVIASIAAGGILYLILWLFGEKDDK